MKGTIIKNYIKGLSFLSLILLGLSITAQIPVFNWVKAIGSANFEMGNSIATDKLGNVYSAGTFSGTIDFDSGPGINTLTSLTFGGEDIYLTKHDASGNLIWVYHFGSSGNDSGPVVTTDAANNVFLIGNGAYTMDYDPGPATYTVGPSTGTFLVKLNATGNFVYAKTFPISPVNPGSPNITAIKIDAFNNIYMTGNFSHNTDFSFGAGLDTITSVKLVGWTYDAFFLKMDSATNFKWVRQIGGYQDDIGHSIAVDNNGNVGVGGIVGSNAKVFSSTGNILIGSTNDAFIAKYSVNGDLKWAHAFGAGAQDGVKEVAFDKYNNLIAGGYFKSTVDFDPGPGTYNLASTLNSFDGFLLKVDTAANFLWIKQIGGGGAGYVDDMYLDSIGSIYLAGSFSGPVEFAPLGMTYTLTGTINENAYISKLDSAGTFLWASQLGNTPNGGVHEAGMAVDKVGNVYTTGAFAVDCDFDTDVSLSYNVASVGNWDIFIHKLGECLTTVPSPVSTTSSSQCSGKGSVLSVAGNGSILWYGSSTSTIVIGSGPTYTTPVLSAGTYTYFAEAKICSTSPRIPIVIVVNSTPTITAISTSSVVCKNTFFEITSSGANAYSWLPGNQTNDTISVTQQIATTYTVNGTALNGCIGTQTIMIGVYPTTPTTLVAGPAAICVGGQSTLSVSGATSYTWSTGNVSNTTIVSPTVTTIYSVTIENNLGCIQTKTITLTVNPLPSITINGVNALCLGSTKTLSVTGANFYSWSTGQTTASISITPTVTSIYTVTGTSAITGCSNTAVKTVSVNAIPNITVSMNNDTVCKGATVTMTLAGASTYTWNGGYVGSTLALPLNTAQDFTVTGTSVDGCISNKMFSVKVYSVTPITATASPSVICSATGTATLLASGALTYTWNSLPAGNPTIGSPPSSTVYTVYGKDGYGCVSSKTVAVTVNQSPSLFFSGLTSVCLGKTANIQVSSTATSYTWNPGNINSYSISVSPTVNTTYTVTGSNPSCTSVSTVAIVVRPLPIITASSGSVCVGQSFTITPAGANTYTYSGGSAIVNPSVTTSYSVTGTEMVYGCISSIPAIATVAVNPLPVITVNSGTICSGESFTIIPTGANTYSISGGANIVSPTANTSYSVTGIDVNGCKSLNVLSDITVNSLPVITVNSGTICSGESYTIIPTGAITYSISGGANVVSPATNSSYSVSGTDMNGCKSLNVVSDVIVNSLPMISVNNGTICSGQSFTIIPTGASTYSISGGSDVVSPVSNVSYSVTGTDVNGCTSLSPAISNVTVSPLPLIIVNSGTICSGQSFTIIPTGADTYTFSSGTDIVSPTANSSYSVAGTDINGCVSLSSSVSSIIVNSLPVITVNSGAICSGESFTIVPNGASTYIISGGTNVVNPTTNASYSVTGMDSNGCESLISAISNVTVNALPSISASSNNTLSCAGDLVTLTAAGASTYTWSTSENTAFITVTPTANTIYSVSTIDGNNCSNMATVTQSVSICTDIKVLYSESFEVFVFPNPTNGILNISMSSMLQNAKLEVYNSIGALVATEILSNKNTTINISNLSSGIYFVKILESAKVIAVKKIVRE